MNLTDGACTLARAEEWILLAGVGRPTETALALWVFMAHIRHRGRYLDEFLEFFLICICVHTVSTVAFFLIRRINVHGLILVPDFFNSELHSANLQNVSLLNFIVLNHRINANVKTWLIIEKGVSDH